MQMRITLQTKHFYLALFLLITSSSMFHETYAQLGLFILTTYTQLDQDHVAHHTKVHYVVNGDGRLINEGDGRVFLSVTLRPEAYINLSRNLESHHHLFPRRRIFLSEETVLHPGAKKSTSIGSPGEPSWKKRHDSQHLKFSAKVSSVELYESEKKPARYEVLKQSLVIVYIGNASIYQIRRMCMLCDTSQNCNNPSEVYQTRMVPDSCAWHALVRILACLGEIRILKVVTCQNQRENQPRAWDEGCLQKTKTVGPAVELCLGSEINIAHV
ncbi:hypothetical protein VNO77_33548 [Canavalia gladiata]|uniref:Uncharacterized protein n=1 Tax=Canavalia gladiata TaxID=3824 RepID=A0AAN9KDZ6_CANGL